MIGFIVHRWRNRARITNRKGNLSYMSRILCRCLLHCCRRWMNDSKHCVVTTRIISILFLWFRNSAWSETFWKLLLYKDLQCFWTYLRVTTITVTAWLFCLSISIFFISMISIWSKFYKVKSVFILIKIIIKGIVQFYFSKNKILS